MNVVYQNIGNIRILEFSTGKTTNPFSYALMQSVIDNLEEADEDDDVKAVILTGGEGNSFSAGGDFNEVRLMQNGMDVYTWIDNIYKLYTAVLKFSKPCIAAIDKHAIGIGFQLSLMCDYRVGTYDCEFVLPELKGGIACTLGGFLMDAFFGRAVMQDVIYKCNIIEAERASSLNLLNELCASNKLISCALEVAEKLASYPLYSFKFTKKILNERIIKEFDDFKAAITLSHIIAIENKSGQNYYSTILKKHNPQEA
jgi:carboxymethylproline synthase